MGKLDTTITVSNAEYRPCFICVRGEPERKALFHRWEDKAEIVPPSPLVCGPDGGVVRGTVGIVEFEDGIRSANSSRHIFASFRETLANMISETRGRKNDGRYL